MALKRVVTQDANLDRIQSNVEGALKPLQDSPFQSGNLLKEIALVTGQDNLIPHKLNHPLSVWVLARQSASATVWEAAAPSDQYLNLKCSANCTVSVWVS